VVATTRAERQQRSRGAIWRGGHRDGARHRGPLAFLAVASVVGHSVDGQSEAIGPAASNAARALESRPASSWGVEGPALCHGYADVLQSTSSPQAASAVTGMFSVRHRFGFQYATHENATDDPGVLNGACGTALALADCSAIPAPAVPDKWDALLLLS
jgi:hypothetical protein